ncbi:MAG: hypothetical protein ABI134_35730 [Byssovorax sp.]
MRALPLISTGVLLVSGLTAACGSTVEETPQGTQSTSGVGGAGGSGATTSTDAVTTTSAAVTTGAGGAGGSGPNIGEPSDIYPAKHPSPPKVITFGGPVLAAPKVYPVFFAGDKGSVVTATTDFYNKLGSTAYWTATTAEYGVGPLTATPPIQLAEGAPGATTDDALQTWLAGKLNANDPAFPTPDANTIIAINYPTGVTIDLQGSKSCKEFLGYHSNLTLDAAHGYMDVAYFVIPRCSPQVTGLSEIDAITSTASHELVEGTTDPYPQTNPAYGQVDTNHIHWLLALGGGETSDLCAQSATAVYKDPEVGYLVQRSWSNKAAAAGKDPCVPAVPGEPYFNSAPVLLDTITLGGGGQSIKVKGVHIPIGSTKTVEIDLFSEAKTSGPWEVAAFDYNEFVGGQPALEFSFDATSGQNGQKLHLDITALKVGQYNAEIFFIVSKLGNQQHAWIGVVGN